MFFFLSIFVSHNEQSLLILENDILVVSAVKLPLTISIFLLVNKARSRYTQRIIAKYLVLYLFGLESVHGLKKQHRVVSLKLNEFTDDHSHNLLKLISAHFEFALAKGVSLRIIHNASH